MKKNSDIPPEKLKNADSAIVFGITDDYGFAVGSFIIGFLKHNPNYRGTMVIYNNSLSDLQKLILKTIYQAISFRNFSRRNVEDRLSQSVDFDVVDRLISRYSIFYFVKFELPDLLDEFERVIWFDVDMLVRGPLEEIWEFDEFIWRPAAPANRLPGSFIKLFEAELKSIAFNRPNGGLIGICRQARNRGTVTTDRLYHWFNELQTRGRFLIADEFTYFLLASNLGANVVELPNSFNCFANRMGCDTAKIIHAVGAEKFWNSETMRLAYPDWHLWYNEWVGHGGEVYKGHVAQSGLFATAPNQLVKASPFQQLWRDIYDEIFDFLPPNILPDLDTFGPSWKFFVQHLLRDQFHLEITKLNRNFKFAFHAKGDSAQKRGILLKIDQSLVVTNGFAKVSSKRGLSWEREVSDGNIGNEFIKYANIIRQFA